MHRYLARQRPQQSALTGSGRARDENVAPRDDDSRKQLGRRTRKPARGFPRRREAAQGDRDATELADRERRTADRRNDRVRAAAVAHPRVDVRLLDGELAPDAGRDAMHELADLRSVVELQIDALELSAALDEDLRRAIDEHVRDLAIVQQRLQPTEPEELGAECLHLLLGQIASDRGAYSLAQRRASCRIGVQHEHRARIEARGDLGAHPRHDGRVDHAILRMSASIARNVGARAAN